MTQKLPHSLGELESQIMDAVWECKVATVRCVLEKLQRSRTIAYTTVMTVMGRLTDKGILKRKRDTSGAYTYTPIKDRKSFNASISKKAITQLLHEYGDVAVAQFIDAVTTSNKKELAEWKTKLKKVK